MGARVVTLDGATVPAALVALALLALAGCLAPPRVARVYDGQVVEERYVSAAAYADFLRGALAEEGGDPKGALAAYALALGEDDEDPEILARMGEVYCRVNPKDPAADRAFGRALGVDSTYAGALAAMARCALLRGRAAEAADLAARAAAQDPRSAGMQALFVHASAIRGEAGARGRQRAIALTIEHGQHIVAWDALIAWGRAHRDAELVARGLEGLVHAAPARADEAERGAVALLADGHLELARRLACAVADAPRDRVRGPRDATAARLAVDEALARGDRDAALARATRGHVPLAEVAARALRLERRDLAEWIADSVVAADPGASGAWMVMAALSRSSSAGAAGGGAAARAWAMVLGEGGARFTDRPPEICALVFADALGASAGDAAARRWLQGVTRTPMAARDPVAGALARDLASRGVVSATELPTEMRPSP